MTDFPIPDYHQHEEFRNRSAKLAEIRALGVNPYPQKYTPTHHAQEIAKEWDNREVGHSEEAAEGKTEELCVAGRLVLFRSMGKNAFAHIQDETGRIQIMCNRELTKVEGFHPTEEMTALKFIEKKIDLGDILGVEGHLFRTQKGELTIFAKKVTLLCKSLLPLPDKHSGLADKGVRYRKRWLDMICHPEVAQQLKKRAQMTQMVRLFLQEEDFLEVETPVLQNTYGGAEARPFKTEINALHQEMFLRISLEITLKKLIIGGSERIFELSKVFRNEGIDRTHNPEFTMLEAYAAYWDYNDMMSFMERLFEKVALELYGTTRIPYAIEEGQPPIEIELKAPWKRMSMKDSLKHYAHIDVDAHKDEALRQLVKEKTSRDPKEIAKAKRGHLISYLFEELVEPHLVQPHHIIDHPIETTPLCKLHRNPKLAAEGIVERFETFIVTKEFANSYSELNDPELQRELLLEQAQKRLGGNEEAHPMDEEFLEAICQGMPPTGGIGIGMDRMAMLFTNAHSIRDVLYFPLMRPEES